MRIRALAAWLATVATGLAAVWSGPVRAAPIVIPQDVVFVADSGASITSFGWTQIKGVMQSVNAMRPPGLVERLGIVRFGTSSQTLYTFQNDQAAVTVNGFIDDLAYLNSGSALLAGVQDAIALFDAQSPEINSRLMVVLSDGTPNPPLTQNPCSLTNPAAVTARADLATLGVETIVVMVGPDRNPANLGCLYNFDPARVFAIEDVLNSASANHDAFFSHFGPTYIDDDPDPDPQPVGVPTPATALLLGAGLLGVCGARRAARTPATA
ncbi:MAG: vWA domain-containing protein [Rhodospirillaceae bacterium]|nr:vWA domain-containing protein [Rhodospirillaceae bacterium]